MQSIFWGKLAFPSTASLLLQFLGTKFSGEWPDVNHQELQRKQARPEGLLEQQFLLPKTPLALARCLSVRVAALGKCLLNGVVGGWGVYLAEIHNPWCEIVMGVCRIT